MRRWDAARLGARLHASAPSGERAAAHVVLALAAAVAVVGLSLVVALAQPAERSDATTPGAAPATGGFAWGVTTSHHDGSTLRTLVVSPDAPAVPGRTEPLADGEALVSPALARALVAAPDLAARVPGEVVGLLPEQSLTSPQSLQAVAADARAELPFRGAGWGRPGADAPDSLPVGPARLLVALLVLLPAAASVAAVAVRQAHRIRPQAAVLALVGAPRRVLTWIAAGAAVARSAPGLLVGALAGALAVRAGGPRGWFGTDVFAPTWLGAVPVAAAVVVAALALGAVTTGLAVRPGVRAEVDVRHEGGWVPAWAAPVGVAAIGVLLALVAVRWAGGIVAAPSAGVLLTYVAAVVVALVTAPFVAVALARAIGRRLPGSAPVPVLLAVRGTQARPGRLVSQTAAVAVLTSVFSLAGAAVLVIDDTGQPPRGGVWTASLYALDADQSQQAAAIAGRDGVLAEQDADGTTRLRATCAALQAVHGAVVTPDGDGCVDGRTYPPGSIGTPGESGELLPLGPVGADGVVITSPPSDVAPEGSSRRHHYLQMPVPDLADWETQVLTVAPIADFVPAAGDVTTLTVLPRLRALLLACLLLGLAPTTVTLLLTARTYDTRLELLGAPAPVARQVATTTAAVTAAIAVLVAAAVATASAQAYLAIASAYRLDVSSLAALAGGGVLVVGVAAAVARGEAAAATRARPVRP